MGQTNGHDLPILIAGGGIGGLAAAYALSLKGFPVRVLEQSDAFREVGAGIQLAPNIFAAAERIGLREALLADAWQPPAMEMRGALSGELVTRLPLGQEISGRFKQPYAVSHRADIHGVFLKACQDSNLISLETRQRVEDFDDDGSTVTALLDGGERVKGRALIGCDGMWSKTREKIIGDGAPRVSGHIAYRAVLKRAEVPDDLWRPDVVLWAGPAHAFRPLPLAPRRSLQPRRGVSLRPL